MFVVGETTQVYGMGEYEDRYIFNLFPIVIICAMGLIYIILAKLLSNKKYSNYLCAVIAIAIIFINIFNCKKYGDYWFERGNGLKIDEVINGTDCIYIRNEPWMLTTMTPILMNADEFIQYQNNEYDTLKERYNKKSKEKKIMAIVDVSFLVTTQDVVEQYGVKGDIDKDLQGDMRKKIYNEIVTYLEDLEPDTEMKKVTEQSIFDRKMEVYLINP